MIIYLILPSAIISTLIALLMMRTSYKFKRWEESLISVYFIFLALCEYFRRYGFENKP